MWSTLPNISVPRSFLAATTVTDPASGRVYSLFGGGEVVEGLDGTDSARVDIFDHTTHAWIAHKDLLSAPRKKLAAVRWWRLQFPFISHRTSLSEN